MRRDAEGRHDHPAIDLFAIEPGAGVIIGDSDEALSDEEWGAFAQALEEVAKPWAHVVSFLGTFHRSSSISAAPRASAFRIRAETKSPKRYIG